MQQGKYTCTAVPVEILELDTRGLELYCNIHSGPRTVGGRAHLGLHSTQPVPEVPVTWGFTASNGVGGS